VEWSSRDGFGTIAGELNRIACDCASCAIPRPAGGRWSFSSRRRAAVHLRAIIVTDAKGQLLKVNQRRRAAGEAATDRMALVNTPAATRF